MQQAQPQIVGVSTRSSVLVQVVACIIGLMALGIAFALGLLVGVLMVAAGSMFEPPVLAEIYRDGGRSTVAIIPVRGVIDERQADLIRVFTDDVLGRSSVRAVVLRVDSPGGGIAPSDQIWYEVERIRAAGIPVVASYGGLAASGGYYVSCSTDHIVAEPTCITGSIGVIAQTFVLKGLFDKVGIEPVTIMATDSPNKDVGNPFRAWTEQDQAAFLELLDSAYAIFTQRVRDGRGGAIADPQQIDEIADGSIYTADEALRLGLIDSIGYLDDAITQAETLARLPAGRATVIYMREPAPLVTELFGARSPLASKIASADDLRSLAAELSAPRAMYLMR